MKNKTLILFILLAILAVNTSQAIESNDVILQVDTQTITFGTQGVDALVLDDGSAETFIGDSGQFIWFNRFTPDATDFPFQLNQVSTIFGGTGTNVGDAIDIVFFEDTDGDGDPATGTVFLGSASVTIQSNDQATFNVYDLVNPVIFNGPGDVLIGLINRNGAEGNDDFPAALDTTSTAQRSWAASYIVGDVPAMPSLPPNEQFGLIDSFGLPGNWIIRGVGSPSSFSIGGNTTGLAAGETVTLQNNGGDDLVVNANGSFAFSTSLMDNDAYNVTITVQPNNQVCELSNNTGTVTSANVDNIELNCVDLFTIGGTTSGLAAGETVTLQNNGGDDLVVNANGSFAFSTSLMDNDAYNVTITAQPNDQVCELSNNTGTVTSVNVDNIELSCADLFTIGGTTSGLAAGETVTLQNNGADDLQINSNGAFVFSQQLMDSDAYNVTITVQPNNQVCELTNNSGNISGNNINNINLSCTSLLTIGGSVSGLTAGTNLIIQNNGADDLLITDNGNFIFSTPLLDNSSYEVTIFSQPANQLCTLNNAIGTLNGNNINNVSINCVPIFSVGGTLSGLMSISGMTSIELQNNGTDNLLVTNNGDFVFDTQLMENDTYNVTILTQPADQVCQVNNGSGTITASNVLNISISCGRLMIQPIPILNSWSLILLMAFFMFIGIKIVVARKT